MKIYQTALFQRGSFCLHSGEHSLWKVECDALTEEDWDALALMALPALSPFNTVHGIPRGGIPFAAALKRYEQPSADGVLLADDVLTSGYSLREARHGIIARPVHAIVAFARGPIPVDMRNWVTAVWTFTAKMNTEDT